MKMRRLVFLSLFGAILLSLFARPAAAESEEWTANFNLLIGIRSLSHTEYWAPVNEQQTYGGEVDFGKKEWPVLAYAGFFESSNSANRSITDVDVYTRMREYSFGLKTNIDAINGFTPHLGFGASFVTAEQRISPRTAGEVADRDENNGGYFAMAGLNYRVGESINFGFGIRTVNGTVIRLFGNETNANYTQYHLLFGGGF